MTRFWAWRTAWTFTFLGICASQAHGQGESIADTSSTGAPLPAACHGERINRIDIHTYPPFDAGGTKLANRIVRLATSLHVTTRKSVVRDFIPIKVGDACADFRLREGERILRAQPFLADAKILVVPDSSGGVDLDVVTFDETSLLLDGSVTSRSPIVRGLRIGDQNVSGEAISAIAGWHHGRYYRDIYRARVVDYQLFGRPYQLSLQGARNEIGGSWDVLASHPFLTDLQSTSWRISGGASTGLRYFRRSHAPRVAIEFTREYSDVGGVVAFGKVRHVFLVGATLSHERERSGANPVRVLDSAVVPDTSTTLMNRYSEHRSSRINLLLGFRNLTYVAVRALDAVEGTQDVRNGIQLSTLLGRGLKLSDSDERDVFVSADIYAGHATTASFAAIEVMGERRRDLDTHVTDGVLESGRAAWYSHPTHKHTSIIDIEFSGGWHQRVPFQLTFADPVGGLRGYRSSQLGGAQRMVMRLEDHYQLGHFRQFASLAGALWIDAGRLWAGEAPFGVTTNLKYSAGVGLLAALPPRSRRTWRIDLAFPLNDRGDAKFEVRITNHDFTRWFWREPGDVQSSRERSIPNSVYNWP